MKTQHSQKLINLKQSHLLTWLVSLAEMRSRCLHAMFLSKPAGSTLTLPLLRLCLIFLVSTMGDNNTAK